MSIHRRGDRNGYQISFTYKFPDGSKRRVREASQHTNKREAEDEERAIRQSLKDGTYNIRAGEDTLAQFSARFFREAMVENEASTKASYSTVYERHLKQGFGSKKLSAISKSRASTPSRPTSSTTNWSRTRSTISSGCSIGCWSSPRIGAC